MSSPARPRVEQLLARLRDPAQRAAMGWDRRALAGGESLWKAGEPASSLAWLEAGALRVLVDGDQRGVIGEGELVGEASVFTVGERRSADLQATRPCVLWVLSRGRLLALRDEVPELYDGLLAAAIATMARRLAQNEHELSRRREGHAQVQAAPGLFPRLVRGLRGRPAPPGFGYLEAFVDGRWRLFRLRDADQIDVGMSAWALYKTREPSLSIRTFWSRPGQLVTSYEGSVYPAIFPSHSWVSATWKPR